MIQAFIDSFMAAEADIKAKFKADPPSSYEEIVKAVIEAVTPWLDAGPDPERIHSINDGVYQGTLVFVIGGTGYQPTNYWYVSVNYGSCSGCDTLEAIRPWDDGPTTDETANDYWTLALHIAQGIKAFETNY